MALFNDTQKQWVLHGTGISIALQETSLTPGTRWTTAAVASRAVVLKSMPVSQTCPASAAP